VAELRTRGKELYRDLEEERCRLADLTLDHGSTVEKLRQAEAEAERLNQAVKGLTSQLDCATRVGSTIIDSMSCSSSSPGCSDPGLADISADKARELASRLQKAVAVMSREMEVLRLRSAEAERVRERAEKQRDEVFKAAQLLVSQRG
jgi:hypothetical protein